MEDAITLDRKSFEALAADSRIRILKSLANRRKTLTELSGEIGLSNSTMKEHLDVLVAAGLAVQLDEGRKWKYYELTRKGKGIFSPPRRELKVLIMLGMSILLVLGSFWNFMGAYSDYVSPAETASAENFPAPMMMASSAKALPQEEAGAGEEAAMAAGAVAGEEAGLALSEEEPLRGEAPPTGEAPREGGGFPLVEALLVAASVILFALALYYAKKET